MRTLLTCSALLLLVNATACAPRATSSPPGRRAADAGALVPLRPDTVWEYRGQRTVLDEQNVARTLELTWRTTVIEVVTRGPITAAILEGHPSDLPWQPAAATPRRSVIVRDAGDRHALITGDAVPRAIARLRAPGDALVGLLSPADLILSPPLTVGARFGEPEQLARTDGWHAWRVESTQALPTAQARTLGLTGPARPTYRLRYQTAPDHTEIDWLPGVGIVRYLYVHHGTAQTVELRLVGFRPGTRRD